jgi:hypothetical protein
MALISAILEKRKSKKIKLSKSELFLINQKYLGDEPIFDGDQLLQEEIYAKSLNWYARMHTREEGVEFLESYLKNSGRIDDLKKMKRTRENMIPETLFWIARIITRGAKLSERSHEWFDKNLNSSFSFKRKEEAELTEKPKINVQSRITDKISDFIGLFEEDIDKHGWTISMYSYLGIHEISAVHVSKIIEFYKPISIEANELLKKGCNVQLLEGYSRYTKSQLKERADFYSKIISDCERFSSNGKVQRAPRKKKVISPDKQLKKLKYLKESNELQLVSCNPEKLLGAQELWTVNTRYKLLTVFYAIDRGGLGVKGTTITNYNTDTSKTYRIGKKTNENVEIVLKNGKKGVLYKLLGSLKETTHQHRINENTILLKVVS